MNTRRPIDESLGPVSLFASFNQQNSLFAAGTDSGFAIFDSDACTERLRRDLGGGIGMIEMFRESNIIALVGGGKQPKFPQNKVIVWDDASQATVATLAFLTPVKRVRLTRSKVVVALQNSVHICTVNGKEIAKYDTADNPLGLCVVSASASTLAFPGLTPGQVQVVCLETKNVVIIPAHSTALRALDISSDASMVATASEKGTLIRLFDSQAGTRLAEFRRGVDPATIFSIAISPERSMVAVTSDKSTLHIFAVPQQATAKRPSALSDKPGVTLSPSEEDGPSQKWGIVGKIPFLPRVFSDDYSVATAPFTTSDDPTPGVVLEEGPRGPIPGIIGGRPAKGIIGWLDEVTILVLGSGRDGRREKYNLWIDGEGNRFCKGSGWKRYLNWRQY